MSTSTETIEELATREYKYGFETTVEADALPLPARGAALHCVPPSGRDNGSTAQTLITATPCCQESCKTVYESCD